MARLPPIVVPGYPRDVTRRDLRSMDVFHLEVDRRELTGGTWARGDPGDHGSAPCKNSIMSLEYRARFAQDC
jgi:hypothetical protein